MSQRREKFLLLAGYIGFALICGLLLWGYYRGHLPILIKEDYEDFWSLLQKSILFAITLVSSWIIFLVNIFLASFQIGKLGWQRAGKWYFFHFDLGFLTLLLGINTLAYFKLFDTFSWNGLLLGAPSAVMLLSWLLVRRALTRAPASPISGEQPSEL